MKHWWLGSLCRWMISEAQRSIGLVPFKIVPDKNGMASLGLFMSQPWKYEIFHASEYDFSAKRDRGSHVVVNKGDYRVIQYSSDPREGTSARSFDSMKKLARHCAMVQIGVAVDRERGPAGSLRSYEELKRFADLNTKHQAELEAALDRHLGKGRIGCANWLIHVLA